jgi:hypothetical protein
VTLARNQLLDEAALLVRRALELHRRGADGRELAEATAFADGYMRGLLLAHLCTARDLLELVRFERAQLDGPALYQGPPRSQSDDEPISTQAARPRVNAQAALVPGLAA